MNKKLAAFLAALTLLFSLAVPVFAADDARVVLGADLNEEQIAAVYKLFDIERGSVQELKVTNAEERRYLDALFHQASERALQAADMLLAQGNEKSAESDGVDPRVVRKMACRYAMYKLAGLCSVLDGRCGASLDEDDLVSVAAAQDLKR